MYNLFGASQISSKLWFKKSNTDELNFIITKFVLIGDPLNQQRQVNKYNDRTEECLSLQKYP